MSSNCLVFHTSGGISSSPAAFLFLIFLRTESSSSCVNGPSLMSNCLLIILVIGSCVIFGGFPSKKLWKQHKNVDMGIRIRFAFSLMAYPRFLNSNEQLGYYFIHRKRDEGVLTYIKSICLKVNIISHLNSNLLTTMSQSTMLTVKQLGLYIYIYIYI